MHAGVAVGDYRYYARITNTEWPPEIYDCNRRFTKTLEAIKRRHDPTVTTVAQGVLEWKQNQRTRNIGLDVQAWLDRFYMSRIGIRFLIGQRRYINTLPSYPSSHTPVVDVALNTLTPHEDYVGIICTRAVSDNVYFGATILTVYPRAEYRTCTILSMKQSRMHAMSARSIMGCSRARPCS